jgi:hypothetical protein
MLGALRGFVAFWIDFIVGDDWRIAAATALALSASWGLLAAGEPAWWLLPAVVIATTAGSLRRAVRAEGRRGPSPGRGREP